MHEFLSVVEAAKVKKVTRQALYLAIKLNRLKAYWHNNKMKVSKKDLIAYDEKKYSPEHRFISPGEPLFDASKGEVSVPRAAEMLNMSRQKLYYDIRMGRLKVEKKKKKTVVVRVADLLEYESRFLNKKLSCGGIR